MAGGGDGSAIPFHGGLLDDGAGAAADPKVVAWQMLPVEDIVANRLAAGTSFHCPFA
jgi:hypothetical protein